MQEQERKRYSKQWRKEHPGYQAAYVRKALNKRRALLKLIKLYYGCQNPDCPVVGRLEPCCIDFHHRENKHRAISSARLWSPSRIAAEINKCTCLCAVCHRLVTNGYLSDTCLPRCSVSDDLIPE